MKLRSIYLLAILLLVQAALGFRFGDYPRKNLTEDDGAFGYSEGFGHHGQSNRTARQSSYPQPPSLPLPPKNITG